MTHPIPAEGSHLEHDEIAKDVLSQQGPDFADIARRQGILQDAIGHDDIVRGLEDLKVPGLEAYRFSWLDLPEADLQGFQGDRVRADKLTFTLANLANGSFRGGNFEAAVGVRAKLEASNLDGTNWNSAILTGVDMTRVSARGANFVDTVMNGVDLTDADLRGARFIGTYLFGVKGLDKANTEGAIFRGARMLSASAKHEETKALSPTDSMLNRAILTEILTAPAERRENSLEKARERDLIIGGSVINASGLEVAGLLLPDLSAEGLRAQGLIFVETNFTGANFKGANFDSAIGTKAKLTGARLGGVSFRGAILVGADMAGAWAPGADFTEADMTGVDVTGANLAGAIFDRTTLEGIVGLDRAITNGTVFRGIYRSSVPEQETRELPSSTNQ